MKKATPFKTYSGLDRGVYVLFIARIVNSMGNFVFPFLTMFLTRKLHFSPARAGTYIVISGLAFIPGSLLGGKLADCLGRKRIMLTFQSLAVLCLIPCAFLGESIIIIRLMILSSFFFGGVIPASDAILIDLTDTEKRKAEKGSLASALRQRQLYSCSIESKKQQESDWADIIVLWAPYFHSCCIYAL